MRTVHPHELQNASPLFDHPNGEKIWEFSEWFEKNAKDYDQATPDRCVLGYLSRKESIFGYIKTFRLLFDLKYFDRAESLFGRAESAAIYAGGMRWAHNECRQPTKTEAVAMLKNLAWSGEVDWNAHLKFIPDIKIPKRRSNTMKRTVLAVVAAMGLLAMPSLAKAESVTLCAGAEGGGYDKLIRVVGTELERKGHEVTLRNLRGSEEIFQELEAGRCDYGPAQRDVYYLFTQLNSSFSSAVRPSAVLYQEVMQGYCSKGSGYDELSDITAGDKIIIDSFGSGSALTWQNMVLIEKEHGGEDDWSQATPIQTPLADAAADISVGEAKCAFGVSGLPAQWMLEGIANGGTVMWLYDGDLNDLEIDGESLYNSLRVPRDNQYKQKFDTYTIQAALFRSQKSKVSKDVDTFVKRAAQAEGAKKPAYH